MKNQIERIALAVRARREAFKLTQRQLAELSGVSPRFVFDLEKAKPTIALDRLTLVLNTLGLEIELRVIDRG
jgi:HTH-type transcriptional regulator/antitoxin HipB